MCPFFSNPLRSLSCQRITLHKNLFLSFVLNSVIMVAWFSVGKEDSVSDPTVMGLVFGHSDCDPAPPSFSCQGTCKLLAFIQMYIMSCNYFWMLCEGIYLHTLIVVAVFAEKQHLMWYYLLGWGGYRFLHQPFLFLSLCRSDIKLFYRLPTGAGSYLFSRTPLLLQRQVSERQTFLHESADDININVHMRLQVLGQLHHVAAVHHPRSHLRRPGGEFFYWLKHAGKTHQWTGLDLRGCKDFRLLQSRTFLKKYCLPFKLVLTSRTGITGGIFRRKVAILQQQLTFLCTNL